MTLGQSELILEIAPPDMRRLLWKVASTDMQHAGS
jgi:hypothetical protein